MMTPKYSLLALFVFLLSPAGAQVGAPYIHDPSTIAECDGKYYTFGTGGGGLISANGWSWESGAERPGGGAAPDVMKIGDRYLCIYGATGGGLGGGRNDQLEEQVDDVQMKSPDDQLLDHLQEVLWCVTP